MLTIEEARRILLAQYNEPYSDRKMALETLAGVDEPTHEDMKAVLNCAYMPDLWDNAKKVAEDMCELMSMDVALAQMLLGYYCGHRLWMRQTAIEILGAVAEPQFATVKAILNAAEFDFQLREVATQAAKNVCIAFLGTCTEEEAEWVLHRIRDICVSQPSYQSSVIPFYRLLEVIADTERKGKYVSLARGCWDWLLDTAIEAIKVRVYELTAFA